VMERVGDTEPEAGSIQSRIARRRAEKEGAEAPTSGASYQILPPRATTK
jgi:hypothetical protein